MVNLAMINRPEVHYNSVSVVLFTSLHSRVVSLDDLVLTEVDLSRLWRRSVTFYASPVSLSSIISHLV